MRRILIETNINVLFEGTKRWWLIPTKMWYGPTRIDSLTNWYVKHRHHVPWTPMECTQQAGDVLYVPTGWNHAIMNLEAVVGLAVELGKNEGLATPSL